MARHGRRYLEAARLIEAEKRYPLDDAAELLPKLSTVKFDATVEAHLRLGVDPRHADQLVRGTVVLPHGTGRSSRVIVFAQGEKAQEALRGGADEVGGEDLVKRIDDGWFEFDVAIATPDMMGMVGRLGKKLGPRGLMPNPKSGTVTFDIERAVGEIKSGRIEFKVDRAGIVHVPVGRASFSPEQLAANVATLVDAVNRSKPSGAKGTFMRTLTLAPTMGPGVRIDIPSALAAASA
jgi:large subunit ribosomal protein L1